MAITVEKGLVSKSALTAISNAIRAKNGSTTKYKPSEMAAAINNIKGEDIIVTAGDKYTLKVINPSNGTITSSLVAKTINNSDGTVSAGITDNSIYKPNTGYDPGTILRSFSKNTGVYTVTGTAASPTSVIDSRGFARMYGDLSECDMYLYLSDDYNGTSTELERANGKIFIAGLNSKSSGRYIDFSTKVYAFFDPYNIDKYNGISVGTSNEEIALAYFSIPNCTNSNFYFGYWYEKFANLKYADFGFIAKFEEFHWKGSVLQTMIIRNTNSKIDLPSSSNHLGTGKITNLYVPSSLLSSYKADSVWSKYVVNFIALEGSKYEDPYAFLDEIPT